MSAVLDLDFIVAEYNEVKYTHRSLANLLFLNALVTAAAGLDSASKLVCFAQK